MDKCCGITGWFFGHCFEARTDDHEESPPGLADKLSMTLLPFTNKSVMLDGDNEALETIESAFARLNTVDSVYVQDVCIRCGQVVDRKQSVSAQPTTSLAEQIYGMRKADWEKAKAYASAAHDRVACPGCFHVFSVGNLAAEAICPNCSNRFPVPDRQADTTK